MITVIDEENYNEHRGKIIQAGCRVFWSRDKKYRGELRKALDEAQKQVSSNDEVHLVETLAKYTGHVDLRFSGKPCEWFPYEVHIDFDAIHRSTEPDS